METGQDGRRLIPWYIGYGLVWAVEYDLYSSPNFFAVTGFDRMPNDLFNMCSLLSGILLSMVAAFLLYRFPRIGRGVRSFAGVVPVVIGLGLLSLPLGSAGIGADILLSVAGVLCGSGFALLAIGFAGCYAAAEPQVTARGIALSFLVGSVGCTIMSLMTHASATICGIVLLIAAGIMLEQGRRASSAAAVRPQPAGGVRRALSYVASVLVFCFVLEALYTASSQIGFSSNGFAYSNQVYNLSIMVAAAIMLLLFMKFDDSLEGFPIFDIAFFAAGAALATQPFMGTDYGLLSGAVIVGCLHVVRTMLIVTVVRVSRELGADAGIVYAVVEGALRLASLVGVCAAVLLFRIDMGFVQMALFSFAGLYVLVCAFMAWGRRRGDRRDSSQAGPTVESLAVSRLDDVQRDELEELAHRILDDRCRNLGEEGGLTPREGDVLRCLAEGYSLARVADILGISLNTVKTHSKMVYVKLDVHNRSELIDLIRG